MSERPGLPGGGDAFAGHTIVRRVGEGARGVVFEGRSAEGNPVALKVLRPELASDPEVVHDFVNEASATGSVRHEGVVKILGHGRSDGLPYILMEFVNGAPLDRLLDVRGRLAWRTATRIALQVARALAHAHGLGYVHRDVKPANILLYRDGSARLTDFGIVKDIRSLKGFLLNGTRVGTSTYASPEQCLGKRLSQGTDIYSLGATLFHMVCGRPPFTGSSPNEIMNKHVKAKLPRPGQVCPGMPRTLCNAIAKMLAKRQTDRYPSMGRLVQDLEFILDGKIAISNGQAQRSASAQQIHEHQLGIVIAVVSNGDFIKAVSGSNIFQKSIANLARCFFQGKVSTLL